MLILRTKGNVVTRVCLSVHRGKGSSREILARCIGLHCSGPPRPDPLDIRPSDIGPSTGPSLGLPLVTSSGYHQRLVQTCSFEDPSPPPPRLASERYRSKWNAFLFGHMTLLSLQTETSFKLLQWTTNSLFSHTISDSYNFTGSTYAYH